MRDKLCVILQSEYSVKHPKYELWTKEVIADSNTVKETLSDHDILEISIPSTAKEAEVIAMVNRILTPIAQPYTSCHIVLNTHGAAGKNDLTSGAIKEILMCVSQKNIAVNQISALLCNGMLAQTSADQRAANPMLPVHASARGKDSSMSILQGRLNHLCTQRSQNFTILGFNTAYDPIRDKNHVVNLLKGEEGIALGVTTQTPSPAKPRALLQEISQSIELIKTTPASRRVGNAAYDTAGNVLGAAMEHMKKNIFAFFSGEMALKTENKPLFNALQMYAQSKGVEFGAKNANLLYKEWLRKNKLFSKERLLILQEYCDLGLSLLEAQVPRSAAKHSDKDILPEITPLKAPVPATIEDQVFASLVAVASGIPSQVKKMVVEKVTSTAQTEKEALLLEKAVSDVQLVSSMR